MKRIKRGSQFYEFEISYCENEKKTMALRNRFLFIKYQLIKPPSLLYLLLHICNAILLYMKSYLFVPITWFVEIHLKILPLKNFKLVVSQNQPNPLNYNRFISLKHKQFFAKTWGQQILAQSQITFVINWAIDDFMLKIENVNQKYHISIILLLKLKSNQDFCNTLT